MPEKASIRHLYREEQRGHSTLLPAVPCFRAKEWHGTGSAEWESNLPFPESWEWSREYFS